MKILKYLWVFEILFIGVVGGLLVSLLYTLNENNQAFAYLIMSLIFAGYISINLAHFVSKKVNRYFYEKRIRQIVTEEKNNLFETMKSGMESGKSMDEIIKSMKDIIEKDL